MSQLKAIRDVEILLDERMELFSDQVEREGLKPIDAGALALWSTASVELKSWIITQGPFLQGAGASKFVEQPDKSFASAVVMGRAKSFYAANGWDGRKGRGKGKMDRALLAAGLTPVGFKGKTAGKGAGHRQPYTVRPEGDGGRPPIWWDAGLDAQLQACFGAESQTVRWDRNSARHVQQGMQLKGHGKGPGVAAIGPVAATEATPADLPAGTGATPSDPLAATASEAGDADAFSDRNGWWAAADWSWSAEEWNWHAARNWSWADDCWERAWSESRGYFWMMREES